MSLVYLKSSIGGYFFDVIFREDYDFENEITKHPVQSGAAINDHIYKQPDKIVFDVGISNCLGSIVNGQFDNWVSRTAKAFDIFYKLKMMAVPLEVDAVIDGAIFSWPGPQNVPGQMVIKSLSVSRTKDTMNALRMTITLQEIVTVAVESQRVEPVGAVTSSAVPPVSADPHTTDQTDLGEVNVSPPGGRGKDIVDSYIQVIP